MDELSVPYERLRDRSVLVATPAYGGQVTLPYNVSLLRTMRLLDHAGIRGDVLYQAGANLDKMRNRLAAHFLASSFTDLLFIDADEGWPAEAVPKLLASEFDVVGIPARKKTQEPQWAVNLLPVDTVTIERGAIEVEGIGTGFLLIRRHALERMTEAYTDLRVAPEHDPPKRWEYFHYALFTTGLAEPVKPVPFGRPYVGEDYTFSRLWRAIGGRVMAEIDTSLVHVGGCEFTGSIGDHLRAVEPR